MRHVRRGIVVLLLLGLPSCADTPSGPKSTVLGTGSYFVDTRASIDDPVLTYLRVGASAGTTLPVFETTAFDTTKVGQSLEASAATDTNFVKATARLADGASGFVCTGDCDLFVCVSHCADEKSFFALGTTDFSPATVAQVDLRLDSTAVLSGGVGGPVRRFFFTVTVSGKR